MSDLTLAVSKCGLDFRWRHYFYGSAPEIPGLLAEKFPSFKVAGTYSPPFRELAPEEGVSIAEMINLANSDILWVGISTPKQERWMAKFVQKLNVPVIIGVGAAFDFHAGRKKQTPLWIKRNGLEWFFRLLTEPRRLWKRYAQLPGFALRVIGQKLGIITYKSSLITQ